MKNIEDLDENFKAEEIKSEDGILWIDAQDPRLTIRGLGWSDEDGGYCRLPLRAEGVVRDPVWTLAQCPSSAHIAFRSDCESLMVRVENADTGIMWHMPGTGSNGLSLYSGNPMRMRYWGSTIPDPNNALFERSFFQDLPRELREFRMYLPLYKEMLKLELGFPEDSQILEPSPLELPKPVVFYGTSITQGGCASTAGSDFVSSVGRRFNIEAINLGFSGNGKGEPEVAELVSEIDASLFVLDYCANAMTELAATLPGFIDTIRGKHPETPILLISDICHSQYDYDITRKELQDSRREIMMGEYVKRRKEDKNIHFVDGFSLIPFGTDAAYCDGVHPSDHGFQLMAERLEPFIEQILF